ncbi:hypothetical protein M6B38_206515 [Iris pallida]|uniref:Uncharacterized protein n=1 Tax=Iris pallida TaxID=29817 RepID=A0AAX6E6K1_IRIPA|nr:hypothetical protein M6B38_206515 [Iris pallida]
MSLSGWPLSFLNVMLLGHWCPSGDYTRSHLQPGLMRRKVCSHYMFTLVWFGYLIGVLSLSLIVAYFIFSIYMACYCILLRLSEDLVISPGVCSYDFCRCSS